MAIGELSIPAFRRFNPLSLQLSLPVARYRFNGQFALRPQAFFLTFHTSLSNQ
jgi:hypothetical protein